METATRLTVSTVAGEVFDSKTAALDLRLVGECIEAALAQLTFTNREIEGVLALDDPCWQSLIRMSAD